MALDLVDEVIDVRVPDTQIMVESGREKEDKCFVESQGHNAAGVLTVYTFLLVVDCIPEDQGLVQRS
jgi:hypothetical protein